MLAFTSAIGRACYERGGKRKDDSDPPLSYIEVTTLASEVASSLRAERVAAFLATVFSAAAAVIVAAGDGNPDGPGRAAARRGASHVCAGGALGLVCVWSVSPQIRPSCTR